MSFCAQNLFRTTGFGDESVNPSLRTFALNIQLEVRSL